MNNQFRTAEADLARTLELELKPRRLWTYPRIFVALLVIALALGAYFYPWHGAALPYVTAPATNGSLTVTVSATGTLQPQDQVDVGAQISGPVDEVRVDYNDQVKKGQILAVINTDQIRAQLAEAEAAQNAARADVANNQATVDLTLKKRDRALALFKIGGMSEQDTQTAEADYQRALASVAKSKADVENAGAQASLYRTQLGFAQVRSPIDGIVLDRKVSKGQTVAAAFQTPVLFTLASDLSSMQLQVDIDEADIGSVHEGQGATFTVDAYPQREFLARLTSVRNSPKTTNGVVTYQGILTVDNKSMLLRPGMTANVNITVSKTNDTLLVPNGALRFTPPGKDALSVPETGNRNGQLSGRVWVLENGKPVARDLKLGRSDGRNTEVISGPLKAGDHVITDVTAVARVHDVEIIRFDNVTKIYGQGEAAVVALDHINLRIAAGEFAAVLGPSGSGKSTAMNILGCLDTPSSGDYFFHGVDLKSLTRDQLALVRRNYFGFVFQGFNLLKRTSALENLELPLVYRGIPRSQRRELARRALALVGLSDREAHTAAELSGGQQQRVAIARALVTNPSVVFADEPTGNLDTARSHEIMQLFRRLNEEHGITIVLVTHEEDVAAYAKRHIRFLDGHIESDSALVRRDEATVRQRAAS